MSTTRIKIGDVYNLLTVVDKLNNDKQGNRVYRCQCACGKEKNVLGRWLLNNKTKSCGCARVRWARELGVKQVGEKSPAARDTTSSFYLNVANDHKRKALSFRKLEFSIDIEAYAKLLKSNCIYCGHAGSNKKIYGKSEYSYNGVDRVDSSKGYVDGNCVPCCKFCNIAKGSMSLNDWNQWISRLVKHQNLNADPYAFYIWQEKINGTWRN